MKPLHYILAEDRQTPVIVPLQVWARWFEQSDRLIAQHMAGDHLKVSTVFLGLDHRFTGDGPPILWETMVFDMSVEVGLLGGRKAYGKSLDMRRYASHEEAMAGHVEVLREYRAQVAAVAKQENPS